jgi:F-type H+-transporting ATPase subunit a
MMRITSDSIVFFSWKGIHLNATIVFTWVVMAVLVTLSLLATRPIRAGFKASRWQMLLETLIDAMKSEISQITENEPGRYLVFLGTLVLFISVSNMLNVVPFYSAPTESLSTTAALTFCVLVAAPVYGINRQGIWGYLKTYAYPMPVMLPFNIISDVSRAVAMSVRLFGNVLSGTLVGAMMLSIIPFIFPVVMNILELLIGQIQAYIFAVLATVIIASALETNEERVLRSTTTGIQSEKE